MPLVSVIVPAFNAEATLDETLRSAAAQTYPNLEILIVDDGSTDRTAEVAEAFCREEPRARVLHKPNGGVASARNFGIAHASGEWLAPVDADDLWHPTKIAKQVAVALAAPERPGFVYCWSHHIDEEGRAFASSWRQTIQGPALDRIAYFNPVGNGSALLISREAARRVGGYDPTLRARGAEGCEDQKIQIGIAQHYPVAVVTEHLVGYRAHSLGMSHNYHQMCRSWQLVYSEFRDSGTILPIVIRWSLAVAQLNVANNRMHQRHLIQAIKPFAAALNLDPVRSSVSIAKRFAELGIRLIKGPRPTQSLPRFGDIGTEEAIPPDSYEIHTFIKLLNAIDRSRLRRVLGER